MLHAAPAVGVHVHLAEDTTGDTEDVRVPPAADGGLLFGRAARRERARGGDDATARDGVPRRGDVLQRGRQERQPTVREVHDGDQHVRPHVRAAAVVAAALAKLSGRLKLRALDPRGKLASKGRRSSEGGVAAAVTCGARYSATTSGGRAVKKICALRLRDRRGVHGRRRLAHRLQVTRVRLRRFFEQREADGGWV